MFRYNMQDAQQALSFLVQQATHIEAEVVKTLYPEIQYPKLIPVDTSANEWAKSVTFFSMDQTGRAGWFHHMAKDMPIADVNRSKFEQGIEMAGIGYRYTLEELGQAMMVPGTNLSADRGDSARRAYEEFVDDVAIRGSTDKGWTGLINDPNVTITEAAPTGTGSSPAWSDKNGDQILQDVNDALTGVHVTTKQIELADTVLLPVLLHSKIATMARTGYTDMTVLEWLSKYNVYTAQTGQQLMIRAVRGLETAGADTDGADVVGRMVVYKRDPRVLKMHIPMPHRFLPVWQTGPITFDVPGIFRLGGVEIRRPGAVRYVDGILDAAYE
jgi:hypothetical protein